MIMHDSTSRFGGTSNRKFPCYIGEDQRDVYKFRERIPTFYSPNEHCIMISLRRYFEFLHCVSLDAHRIMQLMISLFLLAIAEIST